MTSESLIASVSARGYKIPMDLIKELGYTVNQVEHVMTQIPSMVEESIKRIRFMPFDLEASFVGITGGKSSSLVRFLVDRAWPAHLDYDLPPGVHFVTEHSDNDFVGDNDLCISADMLDAFHIKTQFDGTRFSKIYAGDAPKINIRGNMHDLKDMPLYLEQGLYDLQYVYPIFDWTDLQVGSAIFLYNIPYGETT